MRTWLKGVLAEPDGTPSSSRLVMLLWSLTLIVIFAVAALWETYHSKKMPDIAGWGQALALGQAGGTLGYFANQLRRAIAPKEGQS